jgi:hemoglobin
MADDNRPVYWTLVQYPGIRTLGYLVAANVRGCSKEGDAMADTLYKRLGGYDAIAAVADDLLPRLMADPRLGRFWQNRGEDGVRREKQLLIDFLCSSAGGPLYYVGRNMKVSHRGLGINEDDWQVFLGHVDATLEYFKVPPQEKSEVFGFVESLKKDIVE